MMDKPKQRKDRPKKRKFHGNRHTKKAKQVRVDLDLENLDLDLDLNEEPDLHANEPEENGCSDADLDKGLDVDLDIEKSTSASFQKLNDSLLQNEEDAPSSTLSGYRMFDINILLDFFQSFPCPDCFQTHSSGETFSVSEKLVGISSELTLSCKLCKHVLRPLKNVENLNLRFLFSLYSIGCHEQKGKRFLACMNLPKPVSSVSNASYKSKILKATKEVAKENMSKAGAELRGTSESDEVTVSCDGTWQRRGFSSKNGVATCLSVHPKLPAKVIDVEVLSNYCDSCCKMEKKKSGEDLEKWKADHAVDCQRNHQGVAGKMEPDGLLRIFKRSQEKHALKYTGYLGDGDSKSFKLVSEFQPPIYDDKKISKFECCGHVQKRMGKRLMDKVTEYKALQFTENGKKYKGIGGVNRLTNVAIKRIQGHYGGAIRKNVGNLVGMQKAIWAIWNHRKGNHQDCGKWCNEGNRDKNRLPEFVLEAIKPVFEELSKQSLLEKCLHGGTQNANESFHHLIWERCPKTTFVGRDRLEIAVYDAILVFNSGEGERKEVLKLLGLQCSESASQVFQDFNKARIKDSTKQNQEQNKASRALKNIAKASQEAVNNFYEAGAF